MDDRLALMDQGSFLGLRALGHHPCTYATWTYDRPVDLAALSRFNDRLAHTLLGRLIQRSPLPGGRHRWVAVESAPALEVEHTPRPREAIHDWSEELGHRGLDPEHGPGWRLGVLPLTGGGTAVTLVTSHTLADGLCEFQAIADAVRGVRRRPDYPLRGTVGRGGRLWRDLVGAVRSLPRVVRAVGAAIRLARSHSGPGRPEIGPVTSGSVGEAGPFRAPAACVRVEQADWDAAAARLGGTSNTLVSAFAVRLGLRMGRTDARGRVTLAVPVSTRVENDTRANALDSASIVVDPAGLTEDLNGLRAATKQALVDLSRRSHDLAAVLPLVPLTPAVVVRRTEAVAMGAGARPVGCSNHGSIDGTVLRIDGADADDFWVRLGEPGQTAADLDRIGGLLYLVSGRALGRVYLSVAAQPVGGGLDRATLQGLVADTLAEFGLAPVTVAN